MPKRIWILLVAGVLAGSALLAHAVSAQPLTQPPAQSTSEVLRPILVELAGGTSLALDVNDAAEVAGNSDIHHPVWPIVLDWHGVVWKNGVMTDLGALDGSLSSANAINDHGQAAGHSRKLGPNDTRVWHAVRWDNGVIADLGTLDGKDTRANDINNRGQVVGSSQTVSTAEVAFLWDEGVMAALGGAGTDRGSSANAINDFGQAVGYTTGPSGERRAVIWHMGVMTDLGTLGGLNSEAFNINELGLVVGRSDIAASGTPTASHAFLWASGVMTDLGTLGGDESIASAINDLGQVVGISTLPGGQIAFGEYHAFFWDKGVMTDLGTLGGGSCTAAAINENGLVAGHCTAISSFQHAVLWILWDNAALYLPVIGRQAP